MLAPICKTMKVTHTIFLMLVLLNVYSQTTKDKLNERETFLKTVKLKLTDSLTRVEKEIENIKREKESLDYKESKQASKKRYYSKVKGTNPYMTTAPLFGDKKNLKGGEIVELIEVVDQKIKIHSGTSVGYIWPDQLVTNSDLSEIQNEGHKREQLRHFQKDKSIDSLKQIENTKKQIENTKEENRLIQKFGVQTATKILNKEYWIGMTREQALESRGNPVTINESVGTWGRNEQWVYENLFLYFENGVMTSYQRRY